MLRTAAGAELITTFAASRRAELALCDGKKDEDIIAHYRWLIDMSTTAPGLALIDHHVHGILSGELDAPGLESGLMESTAPPPPGTTAFDSQLGFAVRRWCAPVSRPGPAGASR